MFLEQGECLMACFSSRMNVDPQLRSLWRKSNIEDIVKMILKGWRDKYGCKGGGYVLKTSRLMNNFKDQ